MQGSLSIERMCYLAQVSRAGFYRSLAEQMPVEEEMEVRSAIQRIAVAHRRRYGYRRITAELRRCGRLVNHKRVARIMREDNLLAVQPQAFVVTTDSHHQLEVYLNLASRMKLTGINQLWVADILHPITPRVRLPSCDSRFLFPQGGWLGVGSNTGNPAADGSAGVRDHGTKTAARPGASLGPRRAVCVWRLRGDSAEAPDDSEHEPAGEPV